MKLLRREPAAGPELSEDPRIQRLELRRELARTRALWHLAAALAVGVGLTVAQIAGVEEAAIPLVAVAAWLGVTFDRWQSASAQDERIEQDLRALTTIYHESPLTIRKWLTSEFIDDSIRNLLAAALDSEQLAHGYFKQGVAPFLRESQKGFKTHWRYQIDLADLAEPLDVTVDAANPAAFEPGRYRRLHTSVTYMQQVPNPLAEMYYVAVLFEGAELPAWFRRPNFLLRESVQVPEAFLNSLPPRDRQLCELPTAFEPGPTVTAMGEPIADIARRVMKPTVVVGEQELDAAALHVDQSGISWGFHLDGDLLARLRTGSEVHVELETLMARSQRFFPVVIAAPTRNPVVRFNYAMAADIAKVETHVYFSGERPWDARLKSEHAAYRRIDIHTEPEDWVFAGSGCVFTWWDEPGAAP